MGRNVTISILTMMALIILPAGALAADLTAGEFDDNLNYDHFTKYVDGEYQKVGSGILPDINFKDRVTIKLEDENGRGLPNSRVRIIEELSGDVLIDTYTGFDGTFRFFPEFDGYSGTGPVRIEMMESDSGSWLETRIIDPSELIQTRELTVVAENSTFRTPHTLEISFVVDTTGSMGDELSYLKREFENIIDSVNRTYQVDSMRFSLIVYRDHGDEYIVRTFDFTDSIDQMKDRLSAQRPSGGGDYPEAMDQALEESNKLSWSEGNCARILFLVADAPPHDDDLADMVDAISELRAKGIHIYPLASSGVGDVAEFMMRVAAVTTHGRYLFLTDDSGVGNSHAEPHIPGYVVTTLKDLMVRIIDSEISGTRVEARPDQVIRQVGKVENGVVVREDPEEIEEQQHYRNVTDDDEVDIDPVDPASTTLPEVEETPSDPDPAPTMEETSSITESPSSSGPGISESPAPAPEVKKDSDDGSSSGEIFGWDIEPTTSGDADDTGFGFDILNENKEGESSDVFFPMFILIGMIAAVVVIVIAVVVAKKKKND